MDAATENRETKLRLRLLMTALHLNPDPTHPIIYVLEGMGIRTPIDSRASESCD